MYNKLKKYIKKHLPEILLIKLWEIKCNPGEYAKNFINTIGVKIHLFLSPDEPNLKSYFKYILHFKDNTVPFEECRNTLTNMLNVGTIDRCHSILLFGALISKKPENVLELGVGIGYVTNAIALALKYNGKGKLTSVDNWCDSYDIEPKWINRFRKLGVRIPAPVSEEDFVRKSHSDTFDFIVSDADHLNAHKWIDETLRILKNDGFAFFHDTNNKEYKLDLVVERVKELGLPHYHFIEKSRPDEKNDRGWLFVINKKT